MRWSVSSFLFDEYLFIYRTSKQTWLFEYDESVLFNISRVRKSIGHYIREEDIREAELFLETCHPDLMD